MPLPGRTRIYIWLGTAAVVLLIVLVPFRFTPSATKGIAVLGEKSRAYLVQRYEKMAQGMKPRADSLRKAIITRNGYLVPDQDSALSAMSRSAAEMLRIIDHLRNPNRETFEEKNTDIAGRLGELMAEFETQRQQLVGGSLPK